MVDHAADAGAHAGQKRQIRVSSDDRLQSKGRSERQPTGSIFSPSLVSQGMDTLFIMGGR
jgi:hypothetical protein